MGQRQRTRFPTWLVPSTRTLAVLIVAYLRLGWNSGLSDGGLCLSIILQFGCPGLPAAGRDSQFSSPESFHDHLLAVLEATLAVLCALAEAFGGGWPQLKWRLHAWLSCQSCKPRRAESWNSTPSSSSRLLQVLLGLASVLARIDIISATNAEPVRT